MRLPALLGCLLLPLLLAAQPVIPRFEALGVNEGLSQSSVYAIHQDHAGFMWFGTADGLNRYDGYEVRNYRVLDDQAAAGNSNYIRGRLCEDADGNIWFANETGIYVYDRGLERLKAVRRFPEGSYGNTIFMALGIRDGYLWLLNAHYGASRFHLRRRTFETIPFPASWPKNNRYNSNGYLTGEGVMVFSMFINGGLVFFDTRTRQYRTEMPNEQVFAFCPGRKKSFIILENGIYIHDSLTGKRRWTSYDDSNKPLNSITHIIEDPFSRLWILTSGNGLVLHDLKTDLRFRYRHDNTKLRSLPFDLLRVGLIDRSGNLWIGTDGGGVCRLDLKPPRFELFPHNEGDYPILKDYFVKCFYEDRRRRIWFGTHSNGLSIFDPEAQTLKNFRHRPEDPSSLGGDIVGSILEDRAGQIWIGHNRGFSLFDTLSGRFVNFRPQTAVPLYDRNIYVFQMRQLQDGRIAAATIQGLACLRKKEGIYETRTFRSGPLNSIATSLVETRPGEIWYTCPQVGLYRAEAHGDSFVAREKYFPGVDLRSVQVDGQDNRFLWVASAKGLIHFDRDSRRFRIYDSRMGLGNNYVYGVLEDEQHNLWLSTNGGLSFFDRRRQQFTNFTHADGLQSNEFNTNAFFRGASGTFYFGGIKGFNWFRSQAPGAHLSETPPQVALSSIHVNEELLLQDSAFRAARSVRLNHRQNTLSFQFSVLDFTRPQANKIRYRLKGWDPGWVLTANRSVRYPNLPPGNYTLLVQAINPAGLESPLLSLRFDIAAPFWKRSWFYVLVSLLIMSVVIAVTRAVTRRNIQRRLRALEKERALDAERNRISRDMHDEIGSGLTQIALLSELIQTQKRAEAELHRDVATISAQARRLVKNMGEIIWTLNPQNDSLENLLAYMREQAQEYFEPFENIDFGIRFPSEVPLLRLSNEQRRNLFLVVKEALHNALKHSGAETIVLEAACDSRQLHFTVRDNGAGMPEKTRAGANGLRNMEKRMLDIGGYFSMKSGGGGTELHFVLPLMSKAALGLVVRKIPER